MKVLYLTINPNRQSTTVPTEGWFRCLEGKGLRPVLASNACGAFQEWARGEGIPSYHVPLVPPSKTNPLPFLKSLWQLRNIVRRHRIDLIHCNEQDCYPIGSYLARVAGLPIVVSVHFTMGRPYCEWAFGGRRCPDRMFFTSQGNLDACAGGVSGVVPQDRWRLLYNGIDQTKYFPDVRRRDVFRVKNQVVDKFVFGVACALRPRKQLEHLFRAALSIPNERLCVAVAGGPVSGDEEYAERLIGDARARIGSRLLYLGHLDDLRDFYNGLDVFVNTSQEEACSLSIAECISCGCPVIGYPSKSVDDQVLPLGGEIVPQDDTEQLTASMLRWIDAPNDQSARRANARRQAKHKFDLVERANQLWDEYCTLVESRSHTAYQAATSANTCKTSIAK